jgi:hypothetical protein
MWIGCLLLLYKASHAIISGKSTHFSRAIEFLYKEYELTTFWWDLMEMLREFLLVGIFVTVEKGTILQITIGTVVSAAYLVSSPLLKPGSQESLKLRSLVADDSSASRSLQQPNGVRDERATRDHGSSAHVLSRPELDSRSSSDHLAQASNFSLLMLFFCCVIYKYDAVTNNSQLAASSDQAPLRRYEAYLHVRSFSQFSTPFSLAGG